MQYWSMLESGEIPSPELVAAWAALDTLAPERIPLWAAHWLTQGYDGEALRTLAGLSGGDTYDVREVLPTALADCTVTIPDSLSHAAKVVFNAMARMYFKHQVTERWIVGMVYSIVFRCEYDDDVMALPLSQVFPLDDEFDEGWGRTNEQLETEVQDACLYQLAASARSDAR